MKTRRTCPYCGERVVNLQPHIRTHTGDRPYKCPQCEYASSRTDTLKIHLTTHTGAKPFKCAKCPYAARQSAHLAKHMRAHRRAHEQMDNLAQTLHARLIDVILASPLNIPSIPDDVEHEMYESILQALHESLSRESCCARILYRYLGMPLSS